MNEKETKRLDVTLRFGSVLLVASGLSRVMGVKISNDPKA